MATKQGLILEHRLVMAQSLGRCLQPWEIVHHKGIRCSGINNRSDNLEDNLEVLPQILDHLPSMRWQAEIIRLQEEILKWQKLTVLLLRNIQKVPYKAI